MLITLATKGSPMKFTTCLFMSACLLLLAACSTTQERRLSPLEQEQAEQRLGEALAQIGRAHV